jgi:hypothetical protein
MIPFNEEIRENKATFVKALHPSKNIIFGFLLAKRKFHRVVYCTTAKLALNILFYCMFY